ncbi:hypothetical protein BLNAU_8052 [Blattamonas nauphoetae]|uniref:Uncharacterized protein n=1 Tax=Blattamonas nauphoetae TaxID=2049346 RepID=A0ABQ9XZQ3_9EUKA|nr:hypothetical protein BLNAU_8052 [Blattamonas nauphoetae]
MRCHFGMDPHRRSSSTLRKSERIKMVVRAHHPMDDLSPSRNEKQKEELKRGKRCDGIEAGHASLRPPNDLCARPLFLTLIEAALLPQLVSILFAWVMGIRVDTVPNGDCGMLTGCRIVLTHNERFVSESLPFTNDCLPILNWRGDELVSEHEKAIVFRSLVAAVKSQPAVDVSVEIQAVKFLQYIDPHGPESANAFLSRLASSTDESLTDFVQCIMVLISSASEVITMAAMKTLKSLFFKSSPKKLLALVKAGLIPELVINLNPQSLSSPEAVHTHTYLLSSIAHPVRLTTPYYLSQLGIEDDDEQQAIYETSLGRNRQGAADISNSFWLLTIRILSRQSASLPRWSPHSPSPSLSLPHCPNCSEMKAVDSDDWLEIVSSLHLQSLSLSETVDIHTFILDLPRSSPYTLEDDWEGSEDVTDEHIEFPYGMHPLSLSTGDVKHNFLLTAVILHCGESSKPQHCQIIQKVSMGRWLCLSDARNDCSADCLLCDIGSLADGWWTDSIATTMLSLKHITQHCSEHVELKLGETGVITLRIITLNGQPACALRRFEHNRNSLLLSTRSGLDSLDLDRTDEEQAICDLWEYLAHLFSLFIPFSHIHHTPVALAIHMYQSNSFVCQLFRQIRLVSVFFRTTNTVSTFTLSHCSNCSEMEAVDADDWQRFDRLLLWTPMRCHFGIDPHRRSSSTLRKSERFEMVVHAHHPMADLSPSRNEKQKEELKRGSVGVLFQSPPSLPVFVASTLPSSPRHGCGLTMSSHLYKIRKTMNTLINATDTSSSTARSDVSSPHLPLPMDCSPFLNWDENRLQSNAEWTLVFQSLVATVKAQPALDVCLQAKAVKFLNPHALFFDLSVTDFIPHVVVLVSTPNRVITAAAMKIVETLVYYCSPPIRLAFIKADLIPQIINTLHPLSLSFVKAQDIHNNLIEIIRSTVWLSRPSRFRKLGIEDRNEQQAVQETVLKQVLAPSEHYLCRLCVNRYSIVDGDQSKEFMKLLARVLEISQYHQPTMDFVVNVPVVLTIPSCLAFFEDEDSIWCFLDELNDPHRGWNETREETREMWKTMHRMLRMEGVEDVTEQRLRNDKDGIEGGWIVENSIEWNKLQGMNIRKRW